MFLRTKPRCLCFLPLNLSWDRRRENKNVHIYWAPPVCWMLGTMQASPPWLFPRRHHCPIFKWGNRAQKSDITCLWLDPEDLGLESTSLWLPSPGFFPHCAWFLRRRNVFPFSHTQQHSANLQTCLSWYFQRCKVSDHPQSFPTNPENQQVCLETVSNDHSFGFDYLSVWMVNLSVTFSWRLCAVGGEKMDFEVRPICVQISTMPLVHMSQMSHFTTMNLSVFFSPVGLLRIVSTIVKYASAIL